MVQKRRNYKKWYWIGGGVLIVAVIVAAIVGVVLNNNGTKNNNEGRGDDAAIIEKKETENTEKTSDNTDGQSEEEKFAEEEVAKKKVVQYEGEDPNKAAELSGIVSYAGVVDGVLMIRVTIDQYLVDGTCELNLLRDGSAVYNSSANIMADVATSTCEGFDVPVTEIGGGSTQIVIRLNSGDKTGEIRSEVGV